MLMKVCLLIVIGCVSVVNAQNPFCSGDLCFIRPESSGKSWMDAQQICRSNNSTLPIADNPSRQKSFVDALWNFQLNGTDVWLGAMASVDDSDNWHWLDGNKYTGIEVQMRGEYSKSYAYVAKKLTDVLAYASPPRDSYSYICQCNLTIPNICTNGTGRILYVMGNRCYVKYDEKLSWFNARNKCLENSCDLVSFSNLSLLDGMVDTNGSWVGLRHSQWNWKNSLTGSSSDVTFTSWEIGQPNDAAPNCLATDMSDFPNWKDISCSQSYSFICQVTNMTNVPSTSEKPFSSSSTTSTTPTTTTSTTTAASTTTTTTSSLRTPDTATTSTSSSSPLYSSTTKSSESYTTNGNNTNSTTTGSVNIALAVGLGVGLGVPFLILIIVVIVVVVVVLRRKHRSRGNAKSTKRFVTNDNNINAENGTIQMTDKKKKGKTRPDDSSAQYATVKAANPDATTNPSSNQGVVYADLQFGQ